jgi:pyruvate kinase
VSSGTRNTKVIVTLGPASDAEEQVITLKDRGVDFVRVNMSHSSLEYLERSIELADKVGIPFILDTEGSQIRTGDLEHDKVYFAANDRVRLHSEDIVGDSGNISLHPAHVVDQLAEGDLVHIDFDTLILRVSDVSTLAEGFVTATAISGGFIGKRKAVVVDPLFDKRFRLPALSPKDYKAIELGLDAGVEHIAVSFVRSAESIREVRRATSGRMSVISKIECIDALERIDEIVKETDLLLIDRGDLSKEIPLEKIPFTQKIIIQKARRSDTPVFVATNLLETMIERSKPTRAEVQDVVNTIKDGAAGLTLAAETAIGKHPIECVNMLNRLIDHAEAIMADHEPNGLESIFIRSLEGSDYLVENTANSLVRPHGGQLVNRVPTEMPGERFLASLPRIELDQDKQMEVEQIAFGTYSPLDGFMGKDDFYSVLEHLRLVDGTIWPLPITLDVSRDVASRLSVGQVIGLTESGGEIQALLELREKYEFDRAHMARKLFGTLDRDHPGVRSVDAMNPVLLSGKITLLRPRSSETRSYELTPRQLRTLFNERGWAKVVGFHTRNVIHRGHEFIQSEAMRITHSDGMLVQPVVGKKKEGDFRASYIIKSYEMMIQQFYPRDKVVCAAFPTFSRYAGPREALFTAICRKNFGCSHFVVGRDHTGVGRFYGPHASHEIFDEFPDLGLEVVRFNEVVYAPELGKHVEREDYAAEGGGEIYDLISGTEARAMFLRGETPPEWFMRPEISKLILDAVLAGEQVFEAGA